MRRNLSIYIALLLCAAAPALAVAEDEPDDRDTPVLRVPSGQYPTIQSAINAAPNHGIVTISGGVFTEALVIQGKSITLQGSENPQSPTEIRAANEIGSLLTFGVGGSGNLRSLTLRGGALGISAPQPDQQWLASVHADRLRILNCGRGIFGKFNTLAISHTTIDGSRWNGMSITQATRLALDALIVSSSSQVGILIFNTVKPPSGDIAWVITNTTVANNDGGGIYIVGGSVPVLISGMVLVDGNRIAGITLNGTSHILIRDTVVTNTLPNAATSLFGDGIDIFSSKDVNIFDSNIHNNARAGVGVFGCDSGAVPANSVALGRNLVQSNAFDVDEERTSGCPTPFSGWVTDVGGNTCGTPSSPASCIAVSASLTPISALPPAP